MRLRKRPSHRRRRRLTAGADKAFTWDAAAGTLAEGSPPLIPGLPEAVLGGTFEFGAHALTYTQTVDPQLSTDGALDPEKLLDIVLIFSFQPPVS